jgi:hypothetical protein
MYSTHIILGVLLAIAFIITVTFFVLHKTKDLVPQEKILYLLIFLIVMLMCSWVCDKLIAIHIPLLTDEESKSVFNILQTTLTLVLGYYLGSKNSTQ